MNKGVSISLTLLYIEVLLRIMLVITTKPKQPGCKKMRGQSEATMVIGDQKL